MKVTIAVLDSQQRDTTLLSFAQLFVNCR